MSDLVPDGFQDLLDRPLVAHLATVRPDGRPQVNPMWFLWDDDRLWLTSTVRRYKHRNVLANPAVAACVTDPADPYRHLELRGAVERIEPDPDGVFWLRLARRYENPAGLPPDVADRVVYVVRPTRVLSFARRASWRPLPAAGER